VGIIALTQAKNAANPDRARTYGWVATGIGIFILLAVIVVIFLYGAMFMSAMNQMEELR
jgi:Na+-driven multidrug efflux pump